MSTGHGRQRTESAFKGVRPCVGCFEPIPGDATLCPHCVTSQGASRWGMLATSLKWAGATVTVLSLVMGVLTLRGLYADWRERNDTVGELIAAAELLESNDGHSQAWAMYGEAVALAPGSTEARRGQVDAAMRRLRHVKIRGDQKFGDVVDPIVPVLYRGLAASTDRGETRRTGDLLAHIGWAYYLLARDRDAAGHRDAFEPGRVDEVLERALAVAPDHVDAHAMLGFWRTLSGAPLESAREHFEHALAHASPVTAASAAIGAGTEGELQDAPAPDSREGVRRLQINAVRFVLGRSSGVTGERRSDAADELLRIADAMRVSGEAPPDEDARYYLFKHYGRMGRGENIDHVLTVLPPADHLATFVWLFEELYVDDPERPHDRYRVDQRLYVTARLTEEAGDAEEALELYQALAKIDGVHEELDILVDDGITRLTGHAPPRAVARAGRKYIDDEIGPDDDPWAFHEETLRRFDPKIVGDNARDAVEYFSSLPDETVDERADDIVTLFDDSRERVRDFLDEQRGVVERQGYTTAYSAGHAENAEMWHRVLWRRLGHFAVEAGELDRAVAELSDLAERAGPEKVHGAVHYDLARAHSGRAARLAAEGADDAKELEAALDNLQAAVDIAVKRDASISWEDVKTDPDLEALRDDPRYLALVRGR